MSPAAARAAAKSARVAPRCAASRSAVTSRAVPTNSRPRPSRLGKLAELHASQIGARRGAVPVRCTGRRLTACNRRTPGPSPPTRQGRRRGLEPRGAASGTASRPGRSPPGPGSLIGLQDRAFLIGEEEALLEGVDQGAAELRFAVPEPGQLHAGPRPGQQLGRGERLDQVVVGACLRPSMDASCPAGADSRSTGTAAVRASARRAVTGPGRPGGASSRR